MTEKIVLIGGGGHCKSVIDSILACGKYEIEGIVDVPSSKGKVVSSITVMGNDNDLEDIFKAGVKYAFITNGSIGNCSIRLKLYNLAKKIGYVFPTIIDPSAIIAKNVVIGEGTFIGKKAIINSCSQIGDMAIVNTGSIIEHDCIIGGFAHIAPGATLSGGVTVGNYTHIGTGCVVIQGINIGSETIIGAGSLVVSNMKSNIKAYGVPCREVGTWKSISLS